MEIKLKKKYRTYSEPDKWKGKTGPKYRNTQQFGTGGSRSGTAKAKHVVKPLGFSGKTIGDMIRKSRPYVGGKAKK